MKTKDKQDIKNKSVAELRTLLRETRGKLFTARLDATQFKLKNTRSLFSLRKDVAVILTALREKEMAAAEQK